MESSELIPVDQPLSQNLISAIAASFDEADIDSVLWGDILLRIFGVPSGLNDVAFVVPDDKVAAAYAILVKMGFRECVLYAECRTAAAGDCAPIPTAHAHIDESTFIGLYKKSNTLWSLPSLRAGRKQNTSKPDVISASDSALPKPRRGRGRGAFSQALLHPVHIPSAHRFTEAFILLTLRDFGKPLEFHWRNMLTYILEFVWADGILDMGDLEPHHRRFLQHYANPCGMGIGKIFDDLRNESTTSNIKPGLNIPSS